MRRKTGIRLLAGLFMVILSVSLTACGRQECAASDIVSDAVSDDEPMAEVEELTASALLEQLPMDEGRLREALCRAAARNFDVIFADGRTGDAEELALLRARTLVWAADGLYEHYFYQDEDGSLTTGLDFAVPTGAGLEQWNVEVPLDWTCTPLLAKTDGVEASLAADGSVTVSFSPGSVSEAVADAYGCVWGEQYPVSGCFGNYRKLFVSSVGSDDNPCLFLLTDQNTVEFVRLLGGMYFGRLVNSGPLYLIWDEDDMTVDFPKIVDFAAGEGVNGATVFAVTEDGSRYDLTADLEVAESCVPCDLGGVWETSLARSDGAFADDGMAISSHDGMTELEFRESGEGYEVNYSGLLGYVGMDETGMVYGYTLTGPDGNELTGALSLLPQWGRLLVSAVGGEDLLGTEGCVEFRRAAE